MEGYVEQTFSFNNYPYNFFGRKYTFNFFINDYKDTILVTNSNNKVLVRLDSESTGKKHIESVTPSAVITSVIIDNTNMKVCFSEKRDEVIFLNAINIVFAIVTARSVYQASTDDCYNTSAMKIEFINRGD